MVCASADLFRILPGDGIFATWSNRAGATRAEVFLLNPQPRRNTRVHFMQPWKERIVREVGYGLLLEGAPASDLVKSMQVKSEPVARKGESA